MLLPLRTLAIGSFLASATASLFPRQNVNPGPVTGDTFIHDPTVVKTPEGTYLAAYTGDNIQLKTSTDRTAWKDIGPAFPDGAPWTTTYTKGNKNLWAPDISYHGKQYFMYYSASSFGSTESAIFLATSTTGLPGSWHNNGIVVKSKKGDDYNAIDGNLYVTLDGQWFLTFGSFWSGIKMIQLDPSTGMNLGGPLIDLAARPNDGGAIEAPFIVQRGDYFYLWVSFDSCCKGADSTYRIMVGRSKELQGPYVDKKEKLMMQGGGTQMLASHGSVHGPGHNAILADNDGDVIFYHYYRDDGVAQLGINLVKYVDDWPVIY
ncbi:unnamed protein product [Diplocarpon coronariae]|uniref:Arabinan endo-1,5-alpha-L-arabinosidase n=1 Tax=Diplocarpon coronariae TaxID=2795749 RepID=A0A218ZEV8_9HELO|nr:arabinan endo-1:5-alpha-L-arabinosidase A [Diplocarpon mali]OWP06073.1 arabinan endo-1,5-alpha-L-arabinosidase A [Marssonina coronariae]